MAVVEDIRVENGGYKNRFLLPTVVRISSETLQNSSFVANMEVFFSVFLKHNRSSFVSRKVLNVRKYTFICMSC